MNAREYFNEFRLMAVATDKNREDAKQLAEKFGLELTDANAGFHLLILDKSANKVASAGIQDLCDGDDLEFSKSLLFSFSILI